MLYVSRGFRRRNIRSTILTSRQAIKSPYVGANMYAAFVSIIFQWLFRMDLHFITDQQTNSSNLTNILVHQFERSFVLACCLWLYSLFSLFVPSPYHRHIFHIHTGKAFLFSIFFWPILFWTFYAIFPALLGSLFFSVSHFEQVFSCHAISSFLCLICTGCMCWICDESCRMHA